MLMVEASSPYQWWRRAAHATSGGQRPVLVVVVSGPCLWWRLTCVSVRLVYLSGAPAPALCAVSGASAAKFPSERSRSVFRPGV